LGSTKAVSRIPSVFARPSTTVFGELDFDQPSGRFSCLHLLEAVTGDLGRYRLRGYAAGRWSAGLTVSEVVG
jgi:hypothetical protein